MKLLLAKIIVYKLKSNQIKVKLIYKPNKVSKMDN